MGDMTLNDWVAIIGGSMAVFGAVTNFIFKLRADRRAEELHAANTSG